MITSNSTHKNLYWLKMIAMLWIM